MLKKTAKAIGNKFVQEVKNTLNQEGSGMPGDWITPLGQISLEAYKLTSGVAEKVRTWNNTKKCIICRATPTCHECKKCQGHCKCTTEVMVAPEEWMCVYCGTPQPMDHRKCDSCGASRPFIK